MAKYNRVNLSQGTRNKSSPANTCVGVAEVGMNEDTRQKEGAGDQAEGFVLWLHSLVLPG